MKAILTIILVAVLAGLTACSPEHTDQVQNGPRDILIALSPCLSDEEKITQELADWSTHEANTRVRVFDGLSGTLITEFTIPKVKYFKEANVRQRIGAPIQKWFEWSRQKHYDAKLSGSGAICIPKLLDRIAEEHWTPENLIILGSPVARFPLQPNFDFALPSFRYPNDGVIANSIASPFSSIGKEHSLAGARVYFIFPGVDTTAWPGDYESHLNKFYGTFFASRAANLQAFTPNLATALNLVNSGLTKPYSDFRPPLSSEIAQMIDANSGAGTISSDVIEKLKNKSPLIPPVRSPDNNLPIAHPTLHIESNGAVNSNLTRITPTPTANQSVTNTPYLLVVENSAQDTRFIHLETNQPVVAKNKPGATIVLRYRSENADLDIYLRPYPAAEEISFKNQSTSLGQYHYEFDFKTGEHSKSIYLPTGCEPKAEIWVNYASGVGFAHGCVSMILGTTQRDTMFSFIPDHGGDASLRRELWRKKSEHWQRINPLDLLTIERTSTNTITGWRK